MPLTNIFILLGSLKVDNAQIMFIIYRRCFLLHQTLFYREICNISVFIKQRLMIANIFYLVNYRL